MNKHDKPLTKDLRTTKSLLRKELDMTSYEFRKYINPIIAENRNISLEEAKNQQKIRHTEVLKLYAKIGEDINEMRKISA